MNEKSCLTISYKSVMFIILTLNQHFFDFHSKGIGTVNNQSELIPYNGVPYVIGNGTNQTDIFMEPSLCSTVAKPQCYLAAKYRES